MMKFEIILPAVLSLGGLAISLMKLNHSQFIFKKKHHYEKKNRLLDLASEWDNQYPRNYVELCLMRNAIYDFCDNRKVDLSLTILCLNCPEPEVAVDSLHRAGHLFNFDPENKSIVRKSCKAWDRVKTIFLFLYYLFSIVSLWLIIFIKPDFITLNSNVEISTYIVLVLLLSLASAHSFFELGRAGRKDRSIKNLETLLDELKKAQASHDVPGA